MHSDFACFKSFSFGFWNFENCQKSTKIDRNCQKLTKIDENQQKSAQNCWKLTKINLVAKHCQDWLQRSVADQVNMLYDQNKPAVWYSANILL